MCHSVHTLLVKLIAEVLIVFLLQLLFDENFPTRAQNFIIHFFGIYYQSEITLQLICCYANYLVNALLERHGVVTVQWFSQRSSGYSSFIFLPS